MSEPGTRSPTQATDASAAPAAEDNLAHLGPIPGFRAVIMAGGQGQRFWPLSTADRPKQFLDLGRSGRTLIQSTYDRVLPLAGDPANVYVATARRYVGLVCEQLPDVPLENLLVEPTPRDSAPAIALACLTIAKRHGDAVTGFFSSDHRIGPGFHEAIRAAAGVADDRGGLVTVGIAPTRPATGYGYIEVGEPAGAGYTVKRFVEKPSARTAEAYLAAGGYLWNAGIFVWRTKDVLMELDRRAPDLMLPLRSAFEAGAVTERFGDLPRISIDYALMERTDRAHVVPGRFEWDDIGDWGALERLVAHDGSNTVVGRHIGHDASGNIVYTEDEGDVVVTLGVNDLVIVKRGHALLLVHKDRVQEIKTLLADERLAELLKEPARKR
ncbi:MAG TPA: mannose-1-phosphate guanylyltransferase [Trueperaceae bacterium]